MARVHQDLKGFHFQTKYDGGIEWWPMKLESSLFFWILPTHVHHAHSLGCVQLFATHGLQPASIFCPWDSPGKNTGMGCHFLLQGNLPNSGTEPAFPASPALAGEFFIAEPAGKPLLPTNWALNQSLPLGGLSFPIIHRLFGHRIA